MVISSPALLIETPSPPETMSKIPPTISSAIPTTNETMAKMYTLKFNDSNLPFLDYFILIKLLPQ